MPVTQEDIARVKGEIADLRGKIAVLRARKTARKDRETAIGPMQPAHEPFTGVQGEPFAGKAEVTPSANPFTSRGVPPISTGGGGAATFEDRTQTIPQMLGVEESLQPEPVTDWASLGRNAARTIAGLGIGLVEVPRKLLSASFQDKVDALHEIEAMLPNLRGDVRSSLGEVLGPIYDAVAGPLGDEEARKRNEASGLLGPTVSALMIGLPVAGKMAKPFRNIDAIVREARKVGPRPEPKPVSRETPRTAPEIEAQLGESLRLAEEIGNRPVEPPKPVVPEGRVESKAVEARKSAAQRAAGGESVDSIIADLKLKVKKSEGELRSLTSLDFIQKLSDHLYNKQGYRPDLEQWLDYLNEVTVKVREGRAGEVPTKVPEGQPPTPAPSVERPSALMERPATTRAGSESGAAKGRLLQKKAKEYYGTTNAIEEAGYILDDGSMLDFSGRSQAVGYEAGKPLLGQPDYLRGQRNIDHRQISDIFDRKEGISGGDAMGEFELQGNAIRFMPQAESYGISFVRGQVLTAAQWRRIASIIKERPRQGYVDLYKEDGSRIASTEFNTVGELRRFYEKNGMESPAMLSKSPVPGQQALADARGAKKAIERGTLADLHPTTEQQQMINSLNEAKTILKGKMSAEKRQAIERSLQKTEAKLNASWDRKPLPPAVTPEQAGRGPTEMGLGITPEQVGKALGALTPDFLKQARNRIGKSPQARELVRSIEQRADPLSNRRAGQELEALRASGLKGMKDTDATALADKMEAGQSPAFRKIMDRMYDKAKAVGIKIVGYRENYFPRTLKEDVRQILYDDLRSGVDKVSEIEGAIKGGQVASITAAMKQGQVSKITADVIRHFVETGQAKNVVEAWKSLRSYVEDDLFRPFANLEKRRTVGFPVALYERNAKVVLPRYVRAWAKRLAEVEVFGPNGEKAQNLVEHIAALNLREGRYAKQLVDSWTGQIDVDRPLHPTVRNVSDAYMNIQMGTKISLGYAPLKNVFQTAISTFTRLGTRRTATAILKLFDPKRRATIRRSGATIQTAHDALSGRQPTGPLSEVTSQLSKSSGFEGINKVNQYVAASGGYDWISDLHKQANGRPSRWGRLDPEHSPKRAQNILRDEFGIDYTKPLTENNRLEATYRFATDSQLQRNVLSDPLSANDPRIRPFWLFKRFGYRQAAYIKDKVIKQELIANDNPLPLLRLAVGGVVSGALVKEAQTLINKIISGQKRDEKGQTTVERVTDAFANAGALGMVSDMVAADDKLRQLKFMAVPIQISDAVKMWDIATTIRNDMDDYGLKDVARRAVKPASKMFGAFPAQLGQRFQTEGQRKGEEANWKGRRRAEMLDAIIEKDEAKAKRIIEGWNDAHPDNPIIGVDDDLYDMIVERIVNKAEKKANP